MDFTVRSETMATISSLDFGTMGTVSTVHFKTVETIWTKTGHSMVD